MSDVAEHTETDIWASPTRDSPDQGRPKTPKTPKTPKSPKTPAGQGRQMEPEDRDAMLRKEIEGIRSINVAVEGIIGTLERTGGNMNTVSQTVNSATTLLNTWTRILSQTEHNRRLILNTSWKGATADLAEQEAEAVQKQQVAERRAAEEQRRERARQAQEEEEEEERQHQASSSIGRRVRRTASTRGARSRGRVASSGATGSTYSADTTSSRIGGSRASSNVGRGFGASQRTRGPR